MEAVKMTVRLPVETHRRLKRRAQEERNSLSQAVAIAVEQWLAAGTERAHSEQERVQHVLRESHTLVKLGDWVDKYIEAAPDVTIEEIRELWMGQRPLSEDIIANRGER